MLKTGKYQFVSLGGAIKHPAYDPQTTQEWGEDWIIWPCDGYGSPDPVRGILHQQKPDILWFMTDPRFYGWLWEMEHEIRAHVPMIYYHVWDNYPYPTFNAPFYKSNDYVACISQVTHDIVTTVATSVDSAYVPHAVDAEIFKPIDPATVAAFKEQKLAEHKGKMIFFWNNRNARRKQSGSLLYWFKEFLDNVGRDKAVLIMHTDPKDQFGQDLEVIIHSLELHNGEIMFSKQKVSNADLAMMYNVADCTINVADAEGFGLATLESQACGTPVILTMTGGLQEQIGGCGEINKEAIDLRNKTEDRVKTYNHGIGIEPAARAIIGSQQVPYIYEDRVSGHDVVRALTQMYEMSPEDRAALGAAAAKDIPVRYNFDNFIETWDQIFTDVNEKYGSWDNRTNYKAYDVEVY